LEICISIGAVTARASLFIHELGHNLGLDDRGKKETAMFTPAKGNGKVYWAVNYLSEEWDALALADCL
jgi:hypothetical protein